MMNSKQRARMLPRLIVVIFVTVSSTATSLDVQHRTVSGGSPPAHRLSTPATGLKTPQTAVYLEHGQRELRKETEEKEDDEDSVVVAATNAAESANNLTPTSTPTPSPTSNLDVILNKLENYEYDWTLVGFYLFVIAMMALGCCMAVFQECCGLSCIGKKHRRKDPDDPSNIHPLDRNHDLTTVQEEEEKDEEDGGRKTKL